MLRVSRLCSRLQKGAPRCVRQKRSISNANLPSHADVVIVGGGIAGCSTLYALSRRGVNALLLERAKVTSGTTWHTAGLVWSLRPNDMEVQLLAASRSVYGRLEEETEQPAGWINNGGLFISHTKVRTDEYDRLATLGKAFGIQSEMLSPSETARRFPLLDGDALHAALWSPNDGVVDPAMACAALTKAARSNACQVYEEVPVLQIQTGTNVLGSPEVKSVVTAHGTINTKCVINCSGAWGTNVQRLVSNQDSPRLPLTVMKHAYVVSESIAGVRGMPNVRDHDDAFYFRIQGDSICMGGYEPNPIFIDKPLPEKFEFQLFELDWEVFQSHVEGASRLCPAFGRAGIKSTVCGPESFTPDHKPLMGEDTVVRGLYHNCGYNSAGMMFSPGCAEQMADWVLKGSPSLPMFTFDVRRFTRAQLSSASWLRERSHEAYARNYDLVFPADEHLGGRGLSRGPLHDQLVKEGAVMQARAGWERPAFYVKEPVPVPAYDFGGYYGNPRNTEKRYEDVLRGDHSFGFSEHHALIAAEALQCRESAALFDMSYYGKFYLTGPEAQQAADVIFTANLQRNDTNKVVYTCALNECGGVEADLTVSVLDEGTGKLHEPIFKGRGFYIVTSGFSAQHVLSHMQKIINQLGLKVTLTDVTSHMGILALQGPNSRDILEEALDVQLSNEEFPVSSHRALSSCRFLRVGWAGELGWEMHAPPERLHQLLQQLSKVPGWRKAGWRALTALSAEKGYHLWNADVRPDDTPVEAGLGFTCRREGDYTGKERVKQQRAHGVMKRYAFFTLDVKKPLFGLETVYRNGEVCGFLRRGDYAYFLDKPIGVAYVTHHHRDTPVTTEYLQDGEYEIESLGVRLPATLHLRSPFDPKNQRIQGNYEGNTKPEPHDERTGGCE